MLLNSISAISPFPNEKIQINLNSLETPVTNARLGIKFIDSYYDYDDEKINTQVGQLYSPSDPTSAYSSPRVYTNIPDVFPLVYPVSSTSDHLLLTFLAQVSAISVYPTQPVPILTPINDRSFYLSAGFNPATGVDYNLNTENYRRSIDQNNLTSLVDYGCSLLIGQPYKSAHQIDKIAASVTNEIKLFINTYFHDSLSNTTNGVSQLIPESLLVKMDLTFPELSSADIYNYSVGFQNKNTANPTSTASTLSGYYIEYIADDIAISSTLSALDITRQPVVQHNKTSLGTQQEFFYIAPSYFSTLLSIPANSVIKVSHESLNRVSSAVAMTSALSTTQHIISSSTLPIYFYNFPCSLSASYDICNPNKFTNAFTVSFQPSASLVNITTSAAQLSTVMIDNFYQTQLPINVDNRYLQMKFLENTDDGLSAKDPFSNITYRSNQWFPASAPLIFTNADNHADNYTIAFEVSSFTGASYDNLQLSCLLNKNNAQVFLEQTDLSQNSIQIQGSIFPNYDPTFDVRWNVFPPENVIIRDAETNEIIPRNTNVPANTLLINVEQLGVDATTITLYSSEFDVSGTTTWTPSESVYSNLSLTLSGNIDDSNRIKTGEISAFFVKDNLLYRVPTDASISWDESINDVGGTFQFRTRNLTNFLEAVTYPSTEQYSIINPRITSRFVDENPGFTDFLINCSVFSPNYNLRGNRFLRFRDYPANSNLFVDISSNINPSAISSEIYTNIVYNTTAVVNLSANLENLTVDPENIIWNTGMTTFTGLSATFNLTQSATCINISANNIQPDFGGFGQYNFNDSLCFYVISARPNFDYIATPSNNYLPNTPLTLFNYTTKGHGMSAYNACHTENVLMSATPGFSRYVWKIGNKRVETTTNTATVPVTYTDVAMNNTVSVSGFDSIYLEEDPATSQNVAFSDNSSLARQPMQFYSFPTMNAEINSTAQIIDVRNNAQNTPTFFINFDTLDVNRATLNLTLSSKAGEVYREPLNLFANNNEISRKFNVGVASAFSISANSYNIFDLFVEGNVLKTIKGYDFCSEFQTISSNKIQISAFDGPDLDIWTTTNLISTAEVATIVNNIKNSVFNPISAFIFQAETNAPQITYNTASTFSASFGSEGLFDVSISAVYPNGSVSSKTYPDFFRVLNDEDFYDENVFRDFSQTLRLPATREECSVAPNTWQYAETINGALRNIQTNVDFLTANCFSYDAVEPKQYVSVLKEKNKNLIWRFDNDFSVSEKSLLGDIKDVVFVGDYLVYINGNKIEIRDNDASLQLRYSSNAITEGEIFKNPLKIDYIPSTNRLVVLDEEKKLVYVFDIDFVTFTLSLTHYWGGVGEKNSRTKLNNPTDLKVINNNIYIVDKDSSVIKIYNENLNWISAISLNEWKNDAPVSITGHDDELFVLSENGNVFVFEDHTFTSSFTANKGQKIEVNIFNGAYLYILDGGNIYVWVKNGSFINRFLNLNVQEIRNMIFKDREIYLILPNSLIKCQDFIQLTRIVNEGALSALNNWSTIFINPDEPVTSFIFNDSIQKVKYNISGIASALQNRFYSIFDENGEFQYFTVSAVSGVQLDIPESNLGINEIVSWETINRELFSVHQYVESLRSLVDSFIEVPEPSSVIWTWDKHKINTSQRTSLNKTAYSWDELMTNNIEANSALSGITWCQVKFDSGFENQFPVCYTWESMQCNSLNALTWEQLECNSNCGYTPKTWEELEQNCCVPEPERKFTPCEKACK